MKLIKTAEGLLLSNAENFDLAQTLDCGQAFRWCCDGNGYWHGIVDGVALKLRQDKSGILFCGVNEADFKNKWARYFDLERNYGEIITAISENEVLQKASSLCAGIRILRQEPFETLCSFIISQNNNIPRIKGIIERLCTGFGEKRGEFYAFPTPGALACLTPEDLAPIRSGFRARYIIDAAKKCASGEIDFAEIEKMPLDAAREKLMTICGVGIKVADCALLFGFGKTDAFPKDVWIKRALDTLFDGELPKCALPYAGIVQQYIYHYARTAGL